MGFWSAKCKKVSRIILMEWSFIIFTWKIPCSWDGTNPATRWWQRCRRIWEVAISQNFRQLQKFAPSRRGPPPAPAPPTPGSPHSSFSLRYLRFWPFFVCDEEKFDLRKNIFIENYSEHNFPVNIMSRKNKTRNREQLSQQRVQNYMKRRNTKHYFFKTFFFGSK